MATRFKLDENLPTVSEERLGGSADSRVLNACRNEARILITFDADFADIRLYPPGSHPGIWVLRPVSQSIANTITLLRGALKLIETETPQKQLWIVEHGRVRIRD